MSKRTFSAGVIALAVLFAACSDAPSPASTTAGASGDPAAAAPAPGFPRQVLGVTIPARPGRIVSASATHTEMLYALEAGDRIVAVDVFSDYPAEVADLPRIDAFNLNVEAVAGFDPDLVILSFDPGDAVAGFGELGIPVILFPTAPATLEDAFAELTAVGAAVGADAGAAELVASMESEIAGLVADVRSGEGEPPTYYHELGEDLYSITSDTFIGSIYSLAGFENIADSTDDTGSGYVQLSAEYILQADPDFIFLADTLCCGQSAASLAGRPGWETLTAVREGRVIELDDSVASRWGPRIVEFLRILSAAASEGSG